MSAWQMALRFSGRVSVRVAIFASNVRLSVVYIAAKAYLRGAGRGKTDRCFLARQRRRHETMKRPNTRKDYRDKNGDFEQVHPKRAAEPHRWWTAPIPKETVEPWWPEPGDKGNAHKHSQDAEHAS